MTVQEMANIIYAEVGVMGYASKWATAQCIRDNNFNKHAFAQPTFDTKDSECIEVAERVMLCNDVPFPNYKVIKMRSKKYAYNDGSPDWRKLNLPPDAFTSKDYEHICTYKTLDNKWFALFFGKPVEYRNVYNVITGVFESKNLAEDYCKQLQNMGIDAFVKKGVI